jgi:hypothetical protein
MRATRRSGRGHPSGPCAFTAKCSDHLHRRDRSVSKIRFSDRGFAPIRRGLREHLGRMSSDAVKFYLWLHLVACWTGKKRGTVETNYAEIVKELHWSETRVKRAFAELRDRYIKFTNRGNQYRCSTIRILKYKKKSPRAQATNPQSDNLYSTA